MAVPTKVQLQEAEAALVKKWSHLLEKVDPKHHALVARLCENQEDASFIREEDQMTTTLPTSVFPTKFAFPLIAQIFPNLVATRLCSVQPMTGPDGKVFYKDYIYTSSPMSASYFAQNLSYAAGTEAGAIKRGRVLFTSATVSATKYILQARWSSEVMEDARALANLDVEADIMAALRDEILGELDALILSDMVSAADPKSVTTAGDVAFSTTPHSNETQHEHNRELFDAIIDASVLVYNRRYRDPDYIIGTPAAVARIQKLADFSPRPASGEEIQVIAGTKLVGTFGGMFDVYKSPHYPVASQLLLGIRGEGYVFAPYIPLELQPLMYENDSDEWSRNIRTRNGRKKTIGGCFATITIS